jgi:erythromycin esterase-like protein
LYRLSVQTPYHKQDYEFLNGLLRNRSIVQLGESIHVTREFPLVRLSLVRYLHEELAFDVLAFEGSVMDAWLAEDYICQGRGSRDQQAIEAQKRAWFGLWQTEPMREVMQYLVHTHTTQHPLYLASFDIQPGTCWASHGSSETTLRAFCGALKAYGATNPSPPMDIWCSALAPFLLGMGQTASVAAPRQEAAERAIREIEDCVRQVLPSVIRRTSAIHARALERVPASLRASVSLRQAAGRAGEDVTGDTAKASYASLLAYQETRDQFNATNAIALRDTVSRSHRIMLWAHHSHVNHNSGRKAIRSMGQNLLTLVGQDLYTVGLFAGEGEAIYVNDRATPPVQKRKLAPASDYDIEGQLATIAPFDYFLDLGTRQDLRLRCRDSVASTRFEADHRAFLTLAKDFHAAIFIHKVTATRIAGLTSSE